MRGKSSKMSICINAGSDTKNASLEFFKKLNFSNIKGSASSITAPKHGADLAFLDLFS